jgi:hypothetical protein
MRIVNKTTETASPEEALPTTSGDKFAVTPENWVKLATASIRVQPNGGFVIRPDKTPAEWRAWVAYLGSRKIPTTFMVKHRVATVPKQWPEEFDGTAEESDKLWLPEWEDQLDREDRKALATGLLRNLSDSMGPLPGAPRNRLTNFQKEAEKQAALEFIEKRKDYWKSPVTLSHGAWSTPDLDDDIDF